MMSDNPPILSLQQPCSEAVSYLVDQFCQAGLVVKRTFDLQTARLDQTPCPCPHHGTEKCDCQMVVLFIYQGNRLPVTIIAHGSDDQTWFSIVNTPYQRADPRLLATVLRLIISPTMSSVKNIHNQQSI